MYTSNAVNLLPNGDFEIDTNNDLKPDWFVYNNADYISRIDTSSPEFVYSGNHSIQFDYAGSGSKTLYIAGPRNLSNGGLNDISVEEGEVYELSFYLKTAANFDPNVTGGIYAQYSFRNDDGVTLGFDESIPQMSPPDDGTPGYDGWVRASFLTRISPHVTKMSMAIVYKGRNAAWVDNAKITLLSSPEVKNLDFEIDIATPTDKPDYYSPRITTINFHTMEKEHEQTYRGFGSAKFETQQVNDVVYYYGSYNDNGSAIENRIAVCPGDTYSYSGFGRVSDDFLGNGFRIATLFYDTTGSYLARTNSVYINSTTWKKAGKESITVPPGAAKMQHIVEAKGHGDVWIDRLALERKNLVRNSSFETDAASAVGKPDFWRPRQGAEIYPLSGIETDPNIVFSGDASAKFSNTTGNSLISYYSGPYSADGSTSEQLIVRPKETYQLEAHIKTNGLIIGNGVRIALIFSDGENNTARFNSPWFTHTSWTQESITATVPEGFSRLAYVVEYSGSAGEAYFDDVTLVDLKSEWYHPPAPIDSFESLSYSPVQDKLAFGLLENKFNVFHNSMEANYKGDGTWENLTVNQDCPLIRLTANAIIGYLNVNEVSPNPIYVERADSGLLSLLDRQQVDGSFHLYDQQDCSTSRNIDGAIMYEGSIATVALLTAYDLNNGIDTAYLDAATAASDYLITNDIQPSVNANFNGFVIWALTEYIVIANKYANPAAPQDPRIQNYLAKALNYFERIFAFQLENGMWADAHNQNMHYHGITARGIINLYRALPDEHPKKEVVRHSAYKAINHIIRSQRTGGGIIRLPGAVPETIYQDNFPMEVVLMGYHYLGYTDLESSLNEFTLSASIMSLQYSQGHRFAGLGLLMHLYYNTPDPLDLSIKVLLESPYNPSNDQMSNSLETLNLIPTNQPFNQMPWNYTGTETNSISSISDWVLTSFRTGIMADTEIARAAALLQTNGQLYFPSMEVLPGNINTPLYIVIETRNHLTIMSPQPISIVNDTLTYDFSMADSYSTGSPGQKQLANGKWVMFSGDINNDLDINGADKTLWDATNGSFNLYLPADLNLNGDVNGNDRIDWSINNGIFSNIDVSW